MSGSSRPALALRAFLVVCLLGAAPAALSRTHTVFPAQDFAAPEGYLYLFQVAIDGGSAIVLAERFDQGRDALLYMRDSSGAWTFRRVLLSVPLDFSGISDRIEMKNAIALLRLGGVLHVYEHLNGDWVEGGFAEPAPYTGDLSISGRRLAAGIDGCTDDTNLLEKAATTGLWTVTGAVDGPTIPCESNRRVTFDLNENTLLVRRNATEMHVYAKYQQEFQWPHVGDFSLPAPNPGPLSGHVRLQKTVAVAPRGHVYRRNGGLWEYSGQFTPIDTAKGTGGIGFPVFRDGVLVASDTEADQFALTKPYVYVDNGTTFDHAAILETPGATVDFDVSKGTVAAINEDLGGTWWLSLFRLPSPLPPLRAIANDFEARDVTAWQPQPNSQFALARQDSNHFYRQSSLAGQATSVLSGSDWSYYQSIEADITPRAFDGGDRWVGLAIQYVDAANHYYVTLRSSGVVQLKRMLGGEFTTLAEAPLALPLGQRRHVRLSVFDHQLRGFVDGNPVLQHFDDSLGHGRVALMTYRARADFDNVYAAPSAIRQLAWKDWVGIENNPEPAYTGGNWPLIGPPGEREGRGQTSTTAFATALTGVATDDQSVSTRVRLDTFNPSPQGAWFGVFARYVDARTHYYLTVRSSGELQIRKQVNGVISVLASAPFAPAPGTFHDLRLDVLGNQLHAFVNGQRVAQALDDAISRGIYGLGTYRTAATFRNLNVLQP